MDTLIDSSCLVSHCSASRRIRGPSDHMPCVPRQVQTSIGSKNEIPFVVPSMTRQRRSAEEVRTRRGRAKHPSMLRFERTNKTVLAVGSHSATLRDHTLSTVREVVEDVLVGCIMDGHLDFRDKNPLGVLNRVRNHVRRACRRWRFFRHVGSQRSMSTRSLVLAS